VEIAAAVAAETTAGNFFGNRSNKKPSIISKAFFADKISAYFFYGEFRVFDFLDFPAFVFRRFTLFVLSVIHRDRARARAAK
jgi:hypothetical protein